MHNPDLQSEFDSLRPGQSTEDGATGRTALKAAIGVGMPPPPLPVVAQTAVKTSDEGLKAGPVKYRVGAFEMPAYMAAPAAKSGLPVVLVVQEVFGKAGMAWYGRLVGQAGELTPRHPIDIAASLQAPVLGLHGGKDQGIPLDTVDKMKAALASGTPAAKASQFVVYPEAGHAFHADYRTSYLKSAADDGWQRAVAWFKANGVA